MGVPKFFRWMSERYPCLSEVVKEYQIPEFDNLYLDMNGIIHPCSHPDDSNPHFRITEETIFNNIFHYIEVLFRMIRPKKVFFMAVDGVAPRAKMNQQRGRRFRSVREAQDREREARNRGEVLPTEKRFDSNCITPGTGFMVRLNAQLRYFVARKISSDPLWQGIRVILSGHDVPGEGEHKVMEFIRYEKSLPEYDHNTRHCLYGLDADLIVLGLCTHEPHFSLLREEVLFTKQQTKRTTVPEEMTFYLLHLSLFREYLGYEFADLQKTLPFPYDLERIIDDWVMLGFLVGNDFVPHLPNLHIRENALPIVYRCYKQVLPTLDGYINDGGTLVLDRFEALMQALAQWELDRLDDQAADQRWLESKRQQGTMDIRYNGKDGKGKKRDKKKADIKLKGRDDFEMFAMFDGLDVAAGEEEELEPVKKKSVFNEIHTNIDDELLEGDESISELEYRQQRRHYYQTKMDVDICPEEALKLAVEYVRAIQWILHYYYDGVCSWSWFYPSHYAPYIGDVHGFSAVPDVVKYDYGQPFLPYEQLLAVLPAASQDSLPECLRPLMTSPSSPIIDYYPEDFETDLNGKTQDWEAVVLIPFIDQTRLLAAIRPLYEQLTPEQASRNVHGDAHMIEYTAEDQGRTESPGYFAPLAHTYARVTPRPRDPFIAERRDLRKGLLPGAHLDVLAAGFPTLRHIEHSFHLSRCKVKVFQQASMGDNMMLTVKTPWGDDQPDAEAEARRLLGRTIFVQWPHLTEATVVAVATPEKRYSLPEGAKEGDKPVVQKLNDTDRTVWIGHMHDIKNEYEGRMGILTDDIPVLVYAKPLTGRKHVATTDGKVMLQKQWSTVPRPYALQTCVRELKTLEGSYTEYKTVGDLFSKGSHCFVLATDSYASMGKVIEVTEKGRVRLDVTLTPEPDFTAVQRKEQRLAAAYFPSYVVAQKLGITSHLVSRLTGCLLIEPGGGVPANNGASNIVGELEDAKVDRDAKFNCAIEVKHNKKNEEMPGYSRRKDNQWMYSGRMIDTLREYMSKFPELIEFLGRNTEGFKFKEGDVWPQPETRAKRVRELKAWLKQLPCANTDRWPCGAPLLEDEVVKALEQAVDNHQPPRPRTRLSVKPHLLYKPSQIGGCSPPDPQATYQLYDRVVNVREGFSVPLGAKGTVIGIRESPEPADVLYDVLYDEPFEGGLALRCSAGRGYKMPPFSLMNISHGLRLKLGQTGQPVANAAAAFAGAGHPMNGSPMTGGGHSQFRHSPGSPFAEPPRSHPSSRSHGQQQQPRDGRTAERQLARNSPQHAWTPEKQHQQQQQQQQGRRGPQQVVTPVASRASPAGGGSPHHRRVAGSGRLAHLANQTPPPIPTCGDTFTDIWQDLQRAAAAAPMPPPPAGIGHEAPARQVLPVSASSLPGGLLPVPVPSLASPAPATGGRPRPVISGQAPAQPVVPVVTQGSCDRLLRLLQNSDGGVPRYTFATADSGAVVATVALPNGRTLRGAAASTKDQAASLAAAAALAELGSSQPAGEHAGGSEPAGGRRQQQQQQQSGADFLSLLRSPVRATMPPPAMPPPAAGDITHSLLQMLGQRSPAPAPAPAPAAAAAVPTPAHGTPQAAAKKPLHPAAAPAGSAHAHASHSRDHGQQRKPAPHSAPQPAHGGRPAVNGTQGGQGIQGGHGGRGGQGGFVPMQVTKKSTPKKPEPGAAGGAERKRSGSGRATTDAPPALDVAGAEAAAVPVEGSDAGAVVADGVATQEGGSVPPNGEQAKKPAGRGRLFRRAPKNRLAAKF